MKKAAKVFIWIGMILHFYLIFPIVIGIFALKTINKANKKEDLKTWGILTIFLCSLLGGVFMLNIEDNELIGTYKNKVYYEKTPVSSETTTNLNVNKNFYNNIYIIAISLLFVIVPICFAFSMYSSSEVVVILSTCQILLFIPIFILGLFLLKRKSWKSIQKQRSVYKINLTLLILFLGLSISLIVMPILDIFFVFIGMLWGIRWGLVIFGLSIATMIIAIIMICVNSKIIYKKIKVAKVKKEKNVKVVKTSKLEIELEEVKRLYEIEAITEEEYNQMRKSVISKYY